MIEYIHNILAWITNFVETFGYFGIFFMTFVESTFIPIPSEITLIPAGYLIAKKEMSLFPVMFVSLTGTLLGSLFNYGISYFFGRKLFINYGKYFFLKEGQLLSIELFFNKYGSISTFFGRMLPGIKHFISFPAGLAKMNIKLFLLYTLAGSSIWLSFLLYLGHVIGENQDMISLYIAKFNKIIGFIALIALAFFLIKSLKNKMSK